MPDSADQTSLPNIEEIDSLVQDDGPGHVPDETEVDYDFNTVTRDTKNLLTDRQLLDYQHRMDHFARWMLSIGKDLEKRDGYATYTADRTMRRINRFDRWRWNQGGEFVYRPEPTLQDGHRFLDALALSDYTEANNAKFLMALRRFYRYQTDQYDLDKWEPKRSWSTTKSQQPQDYLSLKERKKLRTEALDFGTMPWYQNYNSEERERMRPYVANLRDKPPCELTRDDWNNLPSYKRTSMVYAALDAGLRPVEMRRAKTTWLDFDNQQLLIPKEDSSKNRENWDVAIRADTNEILQRWRAERAHLPRYDETDALWLTEKGNPYKSKDLGPLVRKLCKQAGMDIEDRDISWYSIRHSTGTYMTDKKDLAAAKKQLRHIRAETTMKYAHSPVEERRDGLNQM